MCSFLKCSSQSKNEYVMWRHVSACLSVTLYQHWNHLSEFCQIRCCGLVQKFVKQVWVSWKLVVTVIFCVSVLVNFYPVSVFCDWYGCCWYGRAPHNFVEQWSFVKIGALKANFVIKGVKEILPAFSTFLFRFG